MVERRWGEQFQKKVLHDSELHNCKLISKTPFTAGAKAGSSDNALGEHSPWKTVALNNDEHQYKPGHL